MEEIVRHSKWIIPRVKVYGELIEIHSSRDLEPGFNGYSVEYTACSLSIQDIRVRRSRNLKRYLGNDYRKKGDYKERNQLMGIKYCCKKCSKHSIVFLFNGMCKIQVRGGHKCEENRINLLRKITKPVQNEKKEDERNDFCDDNYLFGEINSGDELPLLLEENDGFPMQPRKIHSPFKFGDVEIFGDSQECFDNASSLESFDSVQSQMSLPLSLSDLIADDFGIGSEGFL